MKFLTVKSIDVQEWDKLVSEIYGRQYSFQQQDGCRERGTFSLQVPDQDQDAKMNDSVPEIVNHRDMGVKFAAWLARDPKQPLADRLDEFGLRLWWHRNFYPDVQAVANDLHKKGLLEAGEYLVIIDW